VRRIFGRLVYCRKFHGEIRLLCLHLFRVGIDFWTYFGHPVHPAIETGIGDVRD